MEPPYDFDGDRWAGVKALGLLLGVAVLFTLGALGVWWVWRHMPILPYTDPDPPVTTT